MITTLNTTDLAMSFISANVTKRQLHGKDGLYERIYGHAAAMRSQMCELGKERTMVQMNLKTLVISQTSLSKCSNLAKQQILIAL